VARRLVARLGEVCGRLKLKLGLLTTCDLALWRHHPADALRCWALLAV